MAPRRANCPIPHSAAGWAIYRLPTKTGRKSAVFRRGAIPKTFIWTAERTHALKTTPKTKPTRFRAFYSLYLKTGGSFGNGPWRPHVHHFPGVHRPGWLAGQGVDGRGILLRQFMLPSHGHSEWPPRPGRPDTGPGTATWQAASAAATLCHVPLNALQRGDPGHGVLSPPRGCRVSKDANPKWIGYTPCFTRILRLSTQTDRTG